MTCAVCGKKLKHPNYVYSKTTGNRYCGPADIEACERRAKRKRRASAAR